MKKKLAIFIAEKRFKRKGKVVFNEKAFGFNDHLCDSYYS